MKQSVDYNGQVVTISLAGKIMGDPAPTRMFYGTIAEFLSLNKHNFLIDLGKVDWVNSIGLGMLLAAHKAAKRAGGKVVLCNVHHIESLLSMTNLIKVFDHCNNCDEAQWKFAES